MSRRSLTARGALILGSTALGGLVIGVGGTRAGVLEPYDGFKIAAGLGLLFGLLAVIASLIALPRTRARAGRSGRAEAWIGLALGAVTLTLLLGPVIRARHYPAIHDVTTNPDDAPTFSDAVKNAPGRKNGVVYPDPGPDVIAKQRQAFPDLQQIELALTPPEALDRARAVAEQLGWTVTSVDTAAFTLEAFDTTRTFRFVDDIAIRVRPNAHGGAIIDLRSNSRVGGGDLGANARRIRAFRDAITAAAKLD